MLWISSEGKWKGLSDLWKKNNETVFIFWFDETLRQAQEFISPEVTANIYFSTAREARSHVLENKPVIFAEHFPFKKREQELFQNLNLQEVKILSALDEPLFKRFGADKIIELMRKTGMNESESLEHPMISNAISNAQEKIEKKLITEQSAHSQADWIEKNLPA